MSPVHEIARREHHHATGRLSAATTCKPGVQPINVTSDGPAVLPTVHRADVPVLALHRLERGRLLVSRPALFDQLSRAARVTKLSAPAGSGKTHLLRSWVGETGLEESAAWVSVERNERDPQRFWLSMLDALRATEAGASIVREMSAVPDLDPRGLVENLASIERPVWLLVDSLHELRSDDARGCVSYVSSVSSVDTRVAISSRIPRTASIGCPEGSGSFQSM
jgi:ATP/maltotriose-dependent transcriptional regulator MalT